MVLLGAGTGAAAKHVRTTLPQRDRVAAGVALDGRVSDGRQSAAELAEAAIEARLGRKVALRLDGKTVWSATARELGATAPAQQIEQSLLSVGREVLQKPRVILHMLQWQT